MRRGWLFRDMPPLARWLIGIGGVLWIGPSALDGWAELRHMPAPLAVWQVEVAGGAACLLWGIALIMRACMHHRRDPQSALYTQAGLWFGLLYLAILPNGAILILQECRVLPEGLLEGAIILVSLIVCLFCLVLGVYFWWRKRRLVAL